MCTVNLEFSLVEFCFGLGDGDSILWKVHCRVWMATLLDRVYSHCIITVESFLWASDSTLFKLYRRLGVLMATLPRLYLERHSERDVDTVRRFQLVYSPYFDGFECLILRLSISSIFLKSFMTLPLFAPRKHSQTEIVRCSWASPHFKCLEWDHELMTIIICRFKPPLLRWWSSIRLNHVVNKDLPWVLALK